MLEIAFGIAMGFGIVLISIALLGSIAAVIVSLYDYFTWRNQ